MKAKTPKAESVGAVIQSPQPTIWALRRNVLLQDNDIVIDNLSANPAEGSLYEHLLGYAPAAPAQQEDGHETPAISADNPQLNILNSETGFLVREMVSDDPVTP